MLSFEEIIARVCHEVNRAYCEAIGDYSQVPWEQAPEWQKTSAINGVKFHLANPNAVPSDSHDNWMREKLAQGWVYGEVKSETERVHPCIRPYEELPLQQRVKDYLFIAVVRSMMTLEPIPNHQKPFDTTPKADTNLLGLPVAGYRAQSSENVELVNTNKNLEEQVLRQLDQLGDLPDPDKRWLAIGRTQIEQGFMAVNRSIFKPSRITNS